MPNEESGASDIKLNNVSGGNGADLGLDTEILADTLYYLFSVVRTPGECRRVEYPLRDKGLWGSTDL